MHLIGGTRASEPASIPAGSVLVAEQLASISPSTLPPKVAAIVVDSPPPPSLEAGAIPVVAGLYPDLFREGETVRVDGDRGIVEVADLREVPVVTSFVQRDDGRILLLRRSKKVGSFQGIWAGVSGFLEDPTTEAQALREIEEETGLPRAALSVERAGPPIYARHGATVYTAYPFRVRTRSTEIRLNWENSEFDWVEPSEIDRRPTVPNLDRAWRAVSAGVPRKG